MRPLAALVCAAIAAAIPAQQNKTVPGGMADVEGGSVHTYPFGRVDAAMQILIDADQITTGIGVITGIAFRQNNVTATQVTLGYTKNYRVTAYQVPAMAASMVADLATNVGSATGTVVFLGPLTLPTQAPTTTWPAPFGVQIPFASPLPFDGSLGNLLLLIETTDQGAVTTSYRLDAQLFTASTITGIAADIDGSGCIVQGNSLALATTANTAVLGLTMQQTLTTTGSTAANFVLLGVQRQDLDLGLFGMAGCWARIGGAFVSQLAVGSPAPVQWSIPLLPNLEGMPVFVQAFGIAQSGLLQDSLTSNAQAIRIGRNTTPVVHADSAFRAAASWSKGMTGAYLPVLQLQGVFP